MTISCPLDKAAKLQEMCQSLLSLNNLELFILQWRGCPTSVKVLDTVDIGMKLIDLYSHIDAGLRNLLLDTMVTLFKSDILEEF